MTVELASGAGPKPHHQERQFALRDRLPMWVICRPTTNDFTGQWTARMHLTLPAPGATNLLIVGETIEIVRGQLQSGLIRIGRQPADDPEIEEIWL